MPDLFIANEDITTKTPQKSSSNAKKAEPLSKSHAKKVPLFSAFTEFPENLAFEHQEPNEKIYLFVRKHFITNLRWIIVSIVGFLTPLAFIFILPFFETMNFTLPQNYIFILLAFYYLILIGYAFINFITWYYNVGIITNMRVVDIDIAYITNKNVAATGLSDIVDVEYSQTGFLHNLFDYGNVHMQTEGLKANFEFLNIPHPAKASDTISDLMRAAKS